MYLLCVYVVELRVIGCTNKKMNEKCSRANYGLRSGKENFPSFFPFSQEICTYFIFFLFQSSIHFIIDVISHFNFSSPHIEFIFGHRTVLILTGKEKRISLKKIHTLVWFSSGVHTSLSSKDSVEDW